MDPKISPKSAENKINPSSESSVQMMENPATSSHIVVPQKEAVVYWGNPGNYGGAGGYYQQGYYGGYGQYPGYYGYGYGQYPGYYGGGGYSGYGMGFGAGMMMGGLWGGRSWSWSW